ncbi:MAG: hypothetical protein CMJ51_00880 [Planctomycetaceae bacterium]|nr:hypothetical protein [Planctomycetaceae bacterium]
MVSRMMLKSVLGILLTLCCVQGASAQSFNYWIDPSGGIWNDPTNWSDGFVPGPQEAGYLILGADYTILSENTSAGSLYVDRGNIDFRTTASGALIFNDLCQITGDVSAESPASLRLIGPGTASIGELRLGLANLSSEFTVAEARTVAIDTALATSFSTVRFELNHQSASAGAAMTILDRAIIQGSLVVTGTPGTFPAAGEAVLLVDGRQAYTGIFALPRFGLIQAPAGLDVRLDFDLDQSSGLFRLLVAKTVEATTAAAVDIEQEFDVGTNPVDLLVVDLDGDGDDDLVLIRPTGKHYVLLQAPDGSFITTTDISSAPGTIDGAAGDFDGDGSIDVALISSTTTLGQEVQLFLNPGGDAVFVPGPSLTLSEEPVSITAIRLPDDLAFSGSTGLGITTTSNGRGKTSTYKTSETELTKAGEVEVGDEPGPSDPIDDESKKDAGSAVGVAAQSEALIPQPVLQILRALPAELGGIEINQTVFLSGSAIDFASGDLDDDGIPETLVITDGGQLDLIQYGGQSEVFSVPIPANARAIAIGDLDSEGGRDVIIAFQDAGNQGRLLIYEVMIWPTPGAPDGENRLTLNLRSEVPVSGVDPGTLGAVSGTNSRIVLTGQGSGDARFESRRYEEIPLDGCTSTDLNGDGRIDSADVGLLFGYWGPCRGLCPGDFNDDGVVGSADLGVLFSEWGPC